MPKVLITPEALIDCDGPHIDLLKDAGFEFAFPKNSQFTRGLGDEAEGVDELSGFDALIAGSEHVTAWMLERLPQLRVIARNGVGYDQRGREVSLLNLQYLGEEVIVPSGALPLSFQAVCGGMVL
jgi:hypothetical protein